MYPFSSARILIPMCLFFLLHCKSSDERMICKEECLRTYPCIAAIEYDEGDVCTPAKRKSDTEKRESCYDCCGGFQIIFR